MDTRLDAQRRADDIRTFRDELGRLEREGVAALTPEQRATIAAHHDTLLAGYQQAFDIDRGSQAKQLSLGMRIASLLGALALSASVVFLFRQFWGRLDTAVQVTVLVGTAVATTVATFAVRSRDQSGYFTGLAAAIAFACFVLDLTMLGRIFNVTPSPDAFLAWGVFALVLAYACDVRLLLAAGLICLGVFGAARLVMLGGTHWTTILDRPESVIAVAALILAVPFRFRHARWPAFPALYRALGTSGVLIAVYALSQSGRASALPLEPDTVEDLYQIAGFVVSSAIIGAGVRFRWNDLVNTGVVGFLVFLITKYVDWWWESMPKSLFFLVVGLTAVLTLLTLRRLRAALMTREVTP